MKKYLILDGLLLSFSFMSVAWGGSYTCDTLNATSKPSGYTSMANGNGLADTCASLTTQYFCSSENKTCEAIQVCASCSSGYTMKTKTITDTSLLGICNKSITIPYCCKNCSSCSSDTSWSIDVFKYSGYPGYDRMYERTCNCDGTCTSTAKYRCTDGYCGTASFDPNGGPKGCWIQPENATCTSAGGAVCNPGYYGAGTSCTRCPIVPDTYYDSALTQPVYGTSTSSNNMVLNACFLAPGTYYDSMGSFNISDSGTCYY